MIRHTVQVRPLMTFIGPGPDSGKPSLEPQGYDVEFFRAGDFVENRGYSYSQVDEQTMFIRITNWVRDGEL